MGKVGSKVGVCRMFFAFFLVCDVEFSSFVYKDLLCGDLKREAIIEMIGKSVFFGKEQLFAFI